MGPGSNVRSLFGYTIQNHEQKESSEGTILRMEF